MAVRKKRKDYYEKIIISELPKKVSYQVADFIRELSLIINNENLVVRITKLDITPKEGILNFSITGELYSDNINDSLALFDVFLKKLKSIIGITVKNFIPPSSSTIVKKKNDYSWTFTIIGEKELLQE
jgi:hypothetical protein